MEPLPHPEYPEHPVVRVEEVLFYPQYGQYHITWQSPTEFIVITAIVRSEVPRDTFLWQLLERAKAEGLTTIIEQTAPTPPELAG